MNTPSHIALPAAYGLLILWKFHTHPQSHPWVHVSIWFQKYFEMRTDAPEILGKGHHTPAPGIQHPQSHPGDCLVSEQRIQHPAGHPGSSEEGLRGEGESQSHLESSGNFPRGCPEMILIYWYRCLPSLAATILQPLSELFPVLASPLTSQSCAPPFPLTTLRAVTQIPPALQTPSGTAPPDQMLSRHPPPRAADGGALLGALALSWREAPTTEHQSKESHPNRQEPLARSLMWLEEKSFVRLE